jgi:Tol biopolymer transport system component
MRRLMLAVAVVTVLLAAVATPASATYAGRDGRLAFVRAKQIYTVAATGGAVEQLTRSGHNIRPKWSPDGKRIAYIHRKPSGARDVWVMSANGKNKTRVTRLGNVTAAATWSPDGKTLAFGAAEDPGYAPIYTIRSTAPFGAPVPLQGYLTNCTDCDPASSTVVPLVVDRFLTWSPDGTRIAFFNHDDAQFDDAIFMYYVATGEAREYAVTGAACCGFIALSDLAWGPDGKFGYGSADTGEFDGADPYVKLTYPGFVAAEGDKSPAPSPLGTRIAFTNVAAGGPKIYVATAAGGHRRVVTNGRQPDWQPLP